MARGEGRQLDFKRELPKQNMQELCKDIAGFANTEGGQILVGVDNKKNIVGVNWDQELTSEVTQQGLNCNPNVAVTVEEIPSRKVGTVVVITVPKTSSIHMDSNKRFPQRIMDKTVPMDAMTIISLAKERGLIANEQGMFGQQQSYTRSKPKRIGFLGEYLSDKNPFIRLQAVSDIGSLSFRYEVEEIPSLLEKLLNLLDDDMIDVQIATLNAIGNLTYRMDKKRRDKFRDSFREKLIILSAVGNPFILRNRALQSLAELRDPKVIDVLVNLVLTELSETYAGLAFENIFMRISEADLGYELKERLLKEMSKSEKAEIQERFKVLLTKMMGINWAQ